MTNPVPVDGELEIAKAQRHVFYAVEADIEDGAEEASPAVRDALARLRTAILKHDPEVVGLRDEIERLKRVGRCGGSISGTDWDADGGYAYSYECRLPLGHYGAHEDEMNGRFCEWTDEHTEIDPADMAAYEASEAAFREAIGEGDQG